MNRPTTRHPVTHEDLARTRIGKALMLALAATPLGGCVSSSAFERSAHESLAAPALGQRLEVRNSVGDVTLVADPSATDIRAEVILKGKGSSPARAEDALEDIEVYLEPGNQGTIVARATHPDGGFGKNYEVTWRITAPPSLVLAVKNDVGDVEVAGFSSGLVVSNDVGDVTVRNVTGGATVSTDVGDVGVTAAGPIDIQNDVGDVSVTVLPGQIGPVKARCDVGAVTLSMPQGGWGHVIARAGMGSTSVLLSGMSAQTIRAESDEFQAKLNDGTGPRVEARSGVGDVRVIFVD